LAKAKGELYRFGSALTCNEPNDVDLLVAYDHRAIRPGEVAKTFRPILTGICERFQLPAHVLALSYEELELSAFFQEEHVLLGPANVTPRIA
jgi:hypothetical protein